MNASVRIDQFSNGVDPPAYRLTCTLCGWRPTDPTTLEIARGVAFDHRCPGDSTPRTGMLAPQVVRECPRCCALVRDDDTTWAKHMDWHAGVRDGFHEFRNKGGGEQCRAEMRNSGGGAFWFCNLPPDHWYHQPLPETEQT